MYAFGGLAQEYGRLEVALFAPARVQLFEPGIVGSTVLFDGSAEHGFGVVLHLFTAPVPALEGCPVWGGKMFEVAHLLVLGEGGKAAVDGAPHLGAVVAAPVQDRQDIDAAVAGPEMGLDTAG